MNHIRYQKLLRMGKRAMGIIQAQNLHPAIGVTAPVLRAAYLDFSRSLEELRLASDEVRASAQKSFKVVDRLRQEYDAARAAVLSLGVPESVGQPSGEYAVPEDLLQACQTLVSVLGTHVEWGGVQNALECLTQSLQQAQESWGKTLGSRSNLQKTQTVNRDNADKLDHVLVHLRQVLRSVYGRSSREYQLLRVSKISQEDGVADEPVQDIAQASAVTQIPSKNAA